MGILASLGVSLLLSKQLYPVIFGVLHKNAESDGKGLRDRKSSIRVFFYLLLMVFN